MFDIGFWELIIIAVLALIVAGPERLPTIAATVGLWAGRGKLLLRDFRRELNREISLQEESTAQKTQAKNTDQP